MGATLVEAQRLLAVAHRDEASIGAKTSVLSRARSGAASTTRTGSSPMRPQLAPGRGCGTRRAVPHRAAASGAGALPRRPEPAAGPRRAPSGDARARPSAPAHEDAVWGDAGRAAVQPQGKPIGDHGEIGVGQDEDRVVAGQLERRRCERGGRGRRARRARFRPSRSGRPARRLPRARGDAGVSRLCRPGARSPADGVDRGESHRFSGISFAEVPDNPASPTSAC